MTKAHFLKQLEYDPAQMTLSPLDKLLLQVKYVGKHYIISNWVLCQIEVFLVTAMGRNLHLVYLNLKLNTNLCKNLKLSRCDTAYILLIVVVVLPVSNWHRGKYVALTLERKLIPHQTSFNLIHDSVVDVFWGVSFQIKNPFTNKLQDAVICCNQNQ